MSGGIGGGGSDSKTGARNVVFNQMIYLYSRVKQGSNVNS